MAGPVVAAAVVIPKGGVVSNVADSKTLSEREREEIFQDFLRKRIFIGIGYALPAVIDKVNILNATYYAMVQALMNLPIKPNLVLIDGPYALQHYISIPHKGIVQGDAKSLSVASASIIAKVFRDRLMRRYDFLYPEYGFARHKGYATKEHMVALRRFGPCPIHRLTFRGVKECIEEKREQKQKPLQQTFFKTGAIQSSNVM